MMAATIATASTTLTAPATMIARLQSTTWWVQLHNYMSELKQMSLSWDESRILEAIRRCRISLLGDMWNYKSTYKHNANFKIILQAFTPTPQ